MGMHGSWKIIIKSIAQANGKIFPHTNNWSKIKII